MSSLSPSCLNKKRKEKPQTLYFQPVSHPGTNCAQAYLPSEINQEQALSCRYGYSFGLPPPAGLRASAVESCAALPGFLGGGGWSVVGVCTIRCPAPDHRPLFATTLHHRGPGTASHAHPARLGELRGLYLGTLRAVEPTSVLKQHPAPSCQATSYTFNHSTHPTSPPLIGPSLAPPSL